MLATILRSLYNPMDDHLVECHSGFTHAQRPTALYFEHKRYEVEVIKSEWRTPEGKGFHVETKSGDEFNLFYHEESQTWSLKPK